MAWGRFIDRYVRAIGDERFMAELGPHAAIQNAAIFAGILTQLLKDHQDGRIGFWIRHESSAPKSHCGGICGVTAPVPASSRLMIADVREFIEQAGARQWR